MKLKNKKAQSGIIVAVLVILLVIVAAIILWNVYGIFLKGKANEANDNAFVNQIEIKEAGVFVTGASFVKVERMRGNSTIESIKFVFEDESGKTHLEFIKENIPKFLDYSVYHFPPFGEIGKIKKISVYPNINGKEGIGSSIEADKILVIPSGLVSWWKLDSNANDFIGKNHGKTSGNVEFVFNEGKYSAYFNSGTIDFLNDSSLDLKSEFAIGFFVKTNSLNWEILKKGEGNWNYKIEVTNEGKIKFSYFSSGTVREKESNSIINDGKWHYVLITNMALYFDGKPDSILNINEILSINGGDLIAGNGFSGYLNNLMIFNRSLSESQAYGIYNSLK